MITKRPSELSDDARTLFARSVSEGHTLQMKPWYTPDLQPAIDEIVEAGLGSYDMSHFSDEDHHYLWTKRVSKRYTNAVGRDDGFTVEIRLVQPSSSRWDDGPIVVEFDGAHIDKSSSRRPIGDGTSWRVICRHNTGTDFEHDSMILGDVWLHSVTLHDIYPDGRVVLLGTVFEANLYDYGVDPFKISNGDYTPREDGKLEMCRDKRCEAPHPIGPYIAPEVDYLNGRYVSVAFTKK